MWVCDKHVNVCNRIPTAAYDKVKRPQTASAAWLLAPIVFTSGIKQLGELHAVS